MLLNQRYKRRLEEHWHSWQVGERQSKAREEEAMKMGRDKIDDEKP